MILLQYESPKCCMLTGELNKGIDKVEYRRFALCEGNLGGPLGLESGVYLPVHISPVRAVIRAVV